MVDKGEEGLLLEQAAVAEEDDSIPTSMEGGEVVADSTFPTNNSSRTLRSTMMEVAVAVGLLCSNRGIPICSKEEVVVAGVDSIETNNGVITTMVVTGTTENVLEMPWRNNSNIMAAAQQMVICIIKQSQIIHREVIHNSMEVGVAEEEEEEEEEISQLVKIINETSTTIKEEEEEEDTVDDSKEEEEEVMVVGDTTIGGEMVWNILSIATPLSLSIVTSGR
mmetsp:Transcript_7113/g.16159  ORF Transcript_7113/g.16159 Transcript_7113/m.16159 type:complete len:222 (-) Transcript_7113:93-758(-)